MKPEDQIIDLVNQIADERDNYRIALEKALAVLAEIADHLDGDPDIDEPRETYDMIRDSLSKIEI